MTPDRACIAWGVALSCISMLAKREEVAHSVRSCDRPESRKTAILSPCLRLMLSCIWRIRRDISQTNSSRESRVSSGRYQRDKIAFFVRSFRPKCIRESEQDYDIKQTHVSPNGRRIFGKFPKLRYCGVASSTGLIFDNVIKI